MQCRREPGLINATGTFNPVQWVDNRHLLIVALPNGEQPTEFRLRRQTQRIASDAWRRTAQGREPSRSVIEGGRPPARDERSDRLLFVDVESRRERSLAEGGIKHAMLSPDGQHVAILTQQRVGSPQPGAAIPSSALAPTRLGFLSLHDGSAVRWLDSVQNPVVSFGEHPHRWSPRGQAFAVVAADGAQRAAFIVSPGTMEVRRVTNDRWVSAVAWTGGGQLLVRGRASSGGDRSDWWTVSSSGELRNLTKDLQAAPSELMRTSRPNEMLALASGSLWRIDAASQTVRELPVGAASPVNAVAWPASELRALSVADRVIVRGRQRDVDAWWLIDATRSGVGARRGTS